MSGLPTCLTGVIANKNTAKTEPTLILPDLMVDYWEYKL